MPSFQACLSCTLSCWQLLIPFPQEEERMQISCRWHMRSLAAMPIYLLLVCCLKVNSHSRIILILLLFSGGRGNSEVSKEVNQPSQSGNPTESWESCFVFIKDATWQHSNRKSWEMGKRIMPSTYERMKKLQCCRLRDQGVERPWVDRLSRKVNKHSQPWNQLVRYERRLHKVHIRQTFQDML